MSPSFPIDSLPVLHGRSDFRVWAAMMRTYFRLEGLYEIVEGVAPRESTSQWWSRDAVARMVLTTRVSEDIAVLICEFGTAAKIWTYLKAQFGASGPAENLIVLLHQQQYDRSSTITKLISRFVDYVKFIKADAPQLIPNHAYVMCFLTALENRLPVWVKHIKDKNEEWLNNYGNNNSLDFDILAGQALEIATDLEDDGLSENIFSDIDE